MCHHRSARRSPDVQSVYVHVRDSEMSVHYSAMGCWSALWPPLAHCACCAYLHNHPPPLSTHGCLSTAACHSPIVDVVTATPGRVMIWGPVSTFTQRVCSVAPWRKQCDEHFSPTRIGGLVCPTGCTATPVSEPSCIRSSWIQHLRDTRMGLLQRVQVCGRLRIAFYKRFFFSSSRFAQ